MLLSQPSKRQDKQVYRNDIFSTRFLALGGVIFGTFLLVLVVIFMNAKEQHQKKEKKVYATSMNLAPIKKIKKQVKKVPKKAKRRKSPAKAPLAPSLGNSLAGIDLGIPEFAVGDFDNGGDDILGDVDKNLVMTGSTVDVPPKALNRDAVEYPRSAKDEGITGYVIFNLLIDTKGNIIDKKILESVPNGVFDLSASSAISTWKFSPAQYKNKTVKVWAKQKIRFDLQ